MPLEAVSSGASAGFEDTTMVSDSDSLGSESVGGTEDRPVSLEGAGAGDCWVSSSLSCFVLVGSSASGAAESASGIEVSIISHEDIIGR